MRDRTTWRFDSTGGSSVKSFTAEVSSRQIGFVETQHFFVNIWKGLAPPKVEMLVRFAVLGRVDTVDRLKKFNIVQQANSRYVLCNHFEESCDHLFLRCVNLHGKSGVNVSVSLGCLG